MSQLHPADYHFCTLNHFQAPKPLPSFDFVAKLVEICRVPNTLFESQQKNVYDRKNHILYINNYESYSRALQQKYGRSVLSFEKQLKMIGFKKRKIKQPTQQSIQSFKELQNPSTIKLHSFTDKDCNKLDCSQKQFPIEKQQTNKNITNITEVQEVQEKVQKSMDSQYMFVWRTNRSALIQNQLNDFEEALSEQILKAIQLKQQMEKRKKILDQKLETIIFKSMLSSWEHQFIEKQTDVTDCTVKDRRSKIHSQHPLESELSEALQELKLLSNETQNQSKQFVANISKNMSNQLQLYRMLIYKETNVHCSIEEQ